MCVCTCVRALQNVSFMFCPIWHNLKCYNLWHTAQTWPGGLHFQNAWRFCRNVRRCNFTDSRKESTASPSPIFKKVTVVQPNNVQISCTEFHSYRPKNLVSTNTNSSTPVSSLDIDMAIFLKPAINQSVTVDICYTALYRNMKTNIQSGANIHLRLQIGYSCHLTAFKKLTLV